MKISGFEPETDTNIDLKKLALNVRFQKQRNELYFTTTECAAAAEVSNVSDKRSFPER